MYIIDQNNVGTLYYLFTDHLGSPNLITDASGNTVQELSFDAWGKRRDPATWQPYAVDASIPPAVIDRGFTFHEHLYPFTLINMNGRAYDPLVGRFLSADPYIQAPDNPQNLNRYSYCLNNPLRYSDPSGEFIQFAIYAAFAYLAGANYNKDKETGEWAWNPLTWGASDKPGFQVGVNSSTDGKNWGAYAGPPGGINVAYNNQMGWGLGYSNPNTGDNNFYYPGYNYDIAGQNAMSDLKASKRDLNSSMNQRNSFDWDFYAGIGLMSAEEVYYSDIYGTWLGKDFSFHKLSVKGNGFIGGKNKFGYKWSNRFTWAGRTLSGYNAYNTVDQWRNNEIDTPTTLAELSSNAFSTYGGYYGVAWGVGWETGRYITDREWYQKAIFNLWWDVWEWRIGPPSQQNEMTWNYLINNYPK
jgi:RHS repeat-associated protein